MLTRITGAIALLVLLVLAACQENVARAPDGAAPIVWQNSRINDYEYVKDRFFFLDDPTRAAYGADSGYVEAIDPQSVNVYLDDGDGQRVEEFAVWRGHAVLDLDRERPGPGAIMAPADTVAACYHFEQLDYGTDYSVSVDQRNGLHPILVLKRYIDEDFTLGVTYRDTKRDRWVGTEPGDSPGEDSIFVKMIRPADDLVRDNMNRGPWGPTNRLMLKNVYPLQQSLEDWNGDCLPEDPILVGALEIAIHYRGWFGGVEDPDEIENVRIVRLVGLDYYRTSSTGLELGKDGQIDQVWVDFQKGYLFLPDLRPFAPGDSTTIDLRGRPGDPSSWDVLPRACWNPGIYDTRSCVRGRDRPFYDGEHWTTRYCFEIKYRLP